jgi:hypothetical protein
MACIIPGCRNRARHNVGIRLRRPSTRAIWAPNTDAFLCDDHATQGLEITIVLTPTNTGEIETKVSSPGGRVISRTTPIIHHA